jgi:hypothetical protein
VALPGHWQSPFLSQAGEVRLRLTASLPLFRLLTIRAGHSCPFAFLGKGYGLAPQYQLDKLLSLTLAVCELAKAAVRIVRRPVLDSRMLRFQHHVQKQKSNRPAFGVFDDSPFTKA